MSKRAFTGELENVRACYIENSDIVFLFGYVVEHQSDEYSQGDWFASSFIINVQATTDYYIFYTNNSVYRVRDYCAVIVSDCAIDDIRSGVPPEIAVKINVLKR
ncbi:MAG: hypothetical protein ACJAS3_003245 [Roseivirga sp.]